MSLQPYLTAFRDDAEALMVDACVIDQQTGTTTDDDGYVVPVFGATVYSGACRIQLANTMASTPEAGGRLYTVQRATVQVPVSATGIEVGARVRVTASVYDPDLVGNTYRVRSRFAKTHATARRLECEEWQ